MQVKKDGGGEEKRQATGQLARASAGVGTPAPAVVLAAVWFANAMYNLCLLPKRQYVQSAREEEERREHSYAGSKNRKEHSSALDPHER